MKRVLNTRVAGVSMEGRQSIIEALRGNEACRIVPEPDNPFDPNALKVMVATANGVQCVGYVPAGIAVAVSKALDGESVMCELLEVTGRFEGSAGLGLRIKIEIYLPDPVAPAKKPSLMPRYDPHYAIAWEDDEMSDFGDWGDQ